MRIIGVEQVDLPAHKPETTEYPKWVKVHDSHKVQDGYGNICVQDFHGFYFDRVTKEMTVLVHDLDEETKAISQKD
jgi:hypothetical protein